jgi:phage protein D
MFISFEIERRNAWLFYRVRIEEEQMKRKTLNIGDPAPPFELEDHNNDTVTLDGLGRRFNGTYYLTKVEHTLNGSGYRTKFQARRMHQGAVS